MTSPEMGTRSLAVIAYWSEFSSELRVDRIPHAARSAAILGSELLRIGAVEADPVILENPSSLACIARIRDLAELATDRFFVYLTSHGLYPSVRNTEFRLATSDTTSPDDTASTIVIAELMNILRGHPEKQCFVVVDACYSGLPLEGTLGADRNTLPSVPGGIVYMSSTGARDVAYAPPTDQYTVFTAAVLDTLKSWDESASHHFLDLFEGVTKRLLDAGYPSPQLGGSAPTTQVPVFGAVPSPNRSISAENVLNQSEDISSDIRILYLDDQPEKEQPFRQSMVGSHVDFFTLAADALDAIRASFYDLVVIDLFLGGDVPATEVTAQLPLLLDTRTRAVLVTRPKLLNKNDNEILATVFRFPHRVDSLIWKRTYLRDVYRYAQRISTDRSNVLASIDGLSEAVILTKAKITSRREHQGIPLDLVRHHFRVIVESLLGPWTRIRDEPRFVSGFTIKPFGSGRSSCSVFAVTPKLSTLSSGPASLLLKVGPRSEINEEIERFNAFVQIGVPLQYRTDKIGESLVGPIGGILYSFLGSAGDDVKELAEEDDSTITSAITTLFEKSTSQWHRPAGDPPWVLAWDYFGEHRFPRERFTAAYETLDRSLERDQSCSAFRAEFDKGAFGDIVEEFAFPTSLTHGDFHLGNVVSYGDGLLGIIDYRDVGIGPRSIDFANMEIACWLRSLPDAPTDRAQLLGDVIAAADFPFIRESDAAVAPWLGKAGEHVELIRSKFKENFGDATDREYFSMLWLAAVRRSVFKATAVTRPEERAFRAIVPGLILTSQRRAAL